MLWVSAWKISAQNEKQVKLLLPKQVCQIVGLDLTMIEKTIGNEQTIFKFNVDEHHQGSPSVAFSQKNCELTFENCEWYICEFLSKDKDMKLINGNWENKRPAITIPLLFDMLVVTNPD